MVLCLNVGVIAVNGKLRESATMPASLRCGHSLGRYWIPFVAEDYSVHFAFYRSVGL